jgi:tetratricopeptide (TPR) repeat protein
MKHILFLFIVLGALLQSAVVYAQKKTFTREYTYQASELDSKVSARTNAVNEMRNILLREVGEYLHTKRTFIQNDTSQNYSEKIEAITAGIVEMKPLDEQWDGTVYYIKAEMTVDPAEVNRRISEVLNDKQRTQELEEGRKRMRALELEVMKLQTALAEQKKLAETGNEQNGKTPATKVQALQTAYQKQISQLSIEEYFIEGEYAFEKKDYDTAIDYYLKAVEIDQKNAVAYNKMAYAYDQKYRRSGRFKDSRYKELAKKYYTKALELDPNNFTALYAIVTRYWNNDYNLYFSCARKLIALEPDNTALRKKIILGIAVDYRLNVEYAQQVITWCEEIMAMDTHYTAFAYVTMFNVYDKCNACRDSRYGENKKAFEAYKHQFRLKLAREGNTKMREWFRAQGISWVE